MTDHFLDLTPPGGWRCRICNVPENTTDRPGTPCPSCQKEIDAWDGEPSDD